MPLVGEARLFNMRAVFSFSFFFSGYRVLLLRVHDKAGLPEPLPFLRALEMETCGGREILSVVEERGGAGLPSS